MRDTDRIFFIVKCGALIKAILEAPAAVGSQRDPGVVAPPNFLLGGRRGVLGDSLGAFGDGVLGQFTGKEQTDGGLDLSGGDGLALVVVSEAGSLSGDPLEDVVHERVHDRHSLGAYTGVGVNLLQDLVDVYGVGFLPLPLAFLVTGNTSGLLSCLLLGFLSSDGRHLVSCRLTEFVSKLRFWWG